MRIIQKLFYILSMAMLLSACVLPDVQPPGGGATDVPGTPAIPTALTPVGGETEAVDATLPPATAIASPTLDMTGTPFPAPQNTATPTITPTWTVTPTATPIPYRYSVQAGTPLNTVNFIEPELGCNWMGVGGQVFGTSTAAIQGLVVEVSGELAGQAVFYLAITGSNDQLGPGGFLIKLADQPVGSQDTLFVRLYNLQAEPLSAPVYFDTFEGPGSCEQNFVLVNFNQTSEFELFEFRLPLILQRSPGL